MSPGFTGITVGLMLTVIHLITIPVDNTSVNPARSLATAVFQHGWALSQLWVFIVFPLVGGLLGGLIWKAWSRPKTRDARCRPRVGFPTRRRAEHVGAGGTARSGRRRGTGYGYAFAAYDPAARTR